MRRSDSVFAGFFGHVEKPVIDKLETFIDSAFKDFNVAVETVSAKYCNDDDEFVSFNSWYDLKDDEECITEVDVHELRIYCNDIPAEDTVSFINLIQRLCDRAFEWGCLIECKMVESKPHLLYHRSKGKHFVHLDPVVSFPEWLPGCCQDWR